MLMKASGAISLSKFRVETDDGTFKYGNNSIVRRGDQVRWRLELEIPKKNRGQLFLNPDEKIIVTDTLPAGLEYVESLENPISVNGQTIMWEFKPDDFDTQDETKDTLFTKEIEILTNVRNNASIGILENNATATVTFIENSEVSDEASRGIQVAKDDPDSDDVTGNVLIPVHIGPDPTSSTGMGNNDNKNPRPSITDDSRLKFNFSMAPLNESFPDKSGNNLGKPYNFRQYNVVYDIDENLILEEFSAPGPFEFRPNNNYPQGELFGVQPQYAIKGIVNGVSRTLIPATEVIPNHTYTREELGLGRDEHLSQITLEFQKGYKGIQRDVAPGGLRAVNRAQLEFSIKEGTRGWVENKYKVVGINGKGTSFVHEETNDIDRDLSGPRQANIIGYEPNDNPVGRVSVKLLEDVRGVVTLGNNRMQVNLENINNSGAPMSSSLETVVLLPPGVTLHDEVNASYTNREGLMTTDASYEVLSNDHNGSGRQLVKISWDDSRMTKGESVTAELDVYIGEHAPNQLVFDIYGFSNNENLRAPSNSGGLTDTIIQNDTDNFYGKGTSHPRLKSGNRYTLASKYDIQTEKLIKGPKDDGYSQFTTARYEEIVDYKLKMTNTTGYDISMMTLIDVLPSVGDLGITDNVHRGSQFTPTLEGPITLPESWQGKVNVYYSTVKNPERDELTRYTDWLPNTPKLTNPEGAEAPNWMTESEVTDWRSIHSFKIELEQGDTWIEGQDIEIKYSMKIPSEADIDGENAKNCDLTEHQRAAWNSFAVATDVGQPVEPERVGVAIECDPPEPRDIEKSVENNEGEFVTELVEKARNQAFNYRIDTTIPENVMGYEYLTITDELDDRLEIVEAVVFVDGEAVEYDVQITNQLVTLRVEREELDDITGKQLTLQITVKIKPDVEIEIIDNDATIQVNDNPGKKSNIVKVQPVEGSLTVIKIDATDKTHLEGATFALYRCVEADSLIENCEQPIANGVTGTDGKVTFEQLDPGYYQLVETKAPEGYRILTKPLKIEIEATELNVEVKIENTKLDWELPNTGGIGATIFYILGALFMVGSIFFLIRSRKSED